MLKAMNHVGISVASLDRSIEFYRDLLGMTVVVKATFEGEDYAAILGLEDARGAVALLRLKDTNFQLELFEFTHPSARRSVSNRPVCDHGITHFCIEVADIESEYTRLTAAGVSFHTSPLRFKSGNKATYGRDPDGNVFEMLERAGSA